MSTLRKINFNTVIPLAMVLSMCAGAFATGRLYERMEDTEALAKRMEAQQNIQREEYMQLIQAIKDLTVVNSHRVEMNELRLERLENQD